MRMTLLGVPLGIIAISMALFRGPPAEVRASQEVTRGDADHVQLAATQQWSRAAEATSFANAMLRSGTAVILSCLSAKLEVAVTEMISCPNPHDQGNCARARAASAKASSVCAQQIQKYTSAALGFHQLNAALGRQLGGLLVERAERELGAEISVSRDDDLSEGLPIFSVDTTQNACRQAVAMADELPMITAPFPAEVESRVPGFAKTVLAQVAARACGLANVPPARLRQVPRLDEDSKRDCHALEQQLSCQVAFAEGLLDGCPAGNEQREGLFSLGADSMGSARSDYAGPRELKISSDVAPYASCRERGDRDGGAAASKRATRGTSTTASTGRRWLCSFDRDRCLDDKIVERSEAFLSKHLPGGAFASPGATGTVGPLRSAQRSCTTVTRPVSPASQTIFAGLRRVASFNRASDSTLLVDPLRSTSCGIWYFRDGARGTHEGTPLDEQPFRPAGYSGFALVKGS